MQIEIDAAIDAHAEEAFGFLEALIGAPSTVGHEQAALELFAREAESVGLVAERLPFSNAPVTDPRAGVTPPAELLTADRFQVFASTPGDGEVLVLLNGHMDVVPADTPELWTSPPFSPERRDGRLYGRGTSDMKCGFAIGMLALRALRDVAPGLFAEKRLGFVAVIEEECTGNGALSSIADHGVTGREVILLESTDLGLLVGGVGILWLDIEVVAAAGHANVADSSVNAVELGMRLVAGLQKWAEKLAQDVPDPALPGNAHPYIVSLGRIAAGDWTSSSPATATLNVRVGFPRAWTPEGAEERLHAVIADLVRQDPDFVSQPKVSLDGFRAKGYLLEDPSPLLDGLRAAHTAAHGTPPKTFALGSTTDARVYVNDFGIPAVCYGASGGGMHGIDEYVELQSIVEAARTLARFILMRFSDTEAAA